MRNFRFVNYYDSFDGTHPNVFVPKEQTPRGFESIEEIVNYLLGHKEVGDLVDRQRGLGGKAAFLMFDDETEELAAELGLDVAFPKASLRHRMDSKIETTRLGNEAGVPSVPNTMGRGTDYPIAARAGAPAPGSATTSWCRPPTATPGRPRSSSRTRATGRRRRRRSSGEQIKVMKRIEPRELAIEGVITRHGTLVGPLMAELTGFPELTPVRRRLVRQRRVARAADREAAAHGAGADDRDGRAAAARGLPRATSSWTSCSTPTPARCGSASSTPG